MKSVEPPAFVTTTIDAGGVGRLSKASSSSFGMKTFGSGPSDQAGNWHS
jgi:hypothetical protein